jgi:hypothetical protein
MDGCNDEFQMQATEAQLKSNAKQDKIQKAALSDG